MSENGMSEYGMSEHGMSENGMSENETSEKGPSEDGVKIGWLRTVREKMGKVNMEQASMGSEKLYPQKDESQILARKSCVQTT